MYVCNCNGITEREIVAATALGCTSFDDLQRDLGGAVMQSIFGALLTAGYASAFASAIAQSPQSDQVSTEVQSQLTKSFAGAEEVAQQHPQYSQAITDAARESFLQGDHWAYTVGIIAILVGAAIVLWRFPGKADEVRLRAEYQAGDP